jgi:hypothetical protein
MSLQITKQDVFRQQKARWMEINYRHQTLKRYNRREFRLIKNKISRAKQKNSLQTQIQLPHHSHIQAPHQLQAVPFQMYKPFPLSTQCTK